MISTETARSALDATARHERQGGQRGLDHRLLLGDLEIEDRLLIGPAQVTLTLLHPPGHDYYRILRSKLHWGRGARHGGAGDRAMRDGAGLDAGTAQDHAAHSR